MMIHNRILILMLSGLAALAGPSCSDMIPEQAIQSWTEEISLLSLLTVNNSPKAITAFSFATPPANGTINETDHTIAVAVPWNAVTTALVPSITHTGAGISPASGEARDFTNPVIYTVTAADGSTQAYTVIVSKKEYALRDRGPANGWIFYINLNAATDGWKYLEAAPADQSTGIEWDHNPSATGATATGIGTGFANTKTIITSIGTNYAAGVARSCADGGYTDWFLPSKDELYQMYVILKASGVGGFAGDAYWSSSEDDANYVWGQNFSYGLQGYSYKNIDYRVRAVRAF